VSYNELVVAFTQCSLKSVERKLKRSCARTSKWRHVYYLLQYMLRSVQR